MRGRSGWPGDSPRWLDRPSPRAVDPPAQRRWAGCNGRIDGRSAPSTTCTKEAAMILYGNARQDQSSVYDHGPVAGAPPAIGPVSARCGGLDSRIGGGAGTAMRQGEVSMSDRRATRALYLCGAGSAGRADADGLRAGGRGQGCAPGGGGLFPSAHRGGGDLGDQHRAALPRRASLNGSGIRDRGRVGQHGHRRPGGDR